MATYKVLAHNLKDDLSEEIGEGLKKKQVEDMTSGCIFVGYYGDKPEDAIIKYYIDDTEKIMYTVMKEA